MPEQQLLDPSELGTKEYWDGLYDRELSNFQDEDADEGTVWFSESNAEDAVLNQLDRLAEDGLLRRESDGATPASRFLDLGTGNGHMLFRLRLPEDDDEERWSGEMIGIDYSDPSVRLAQRIAAQKAQEEPSIPEHLRFERWDLLQDSPGSWLQDGFDVVLDKGTFDAISLMDHDSSTAHPCERYREKVIDLVRPSGFLIITSCNWTKQELLHWLTPDRSALRLYAEAAYPTFTFGGKTGQSIVTLVFRRYEG